MKTNFEEKFKELDTLKDILRKIDNNSKIGVFYGLSRDGKKRLTFLSTITPDPIESTKVISVSCYKDSESSNWLSFDLENNDYSNIFYTFCSDMVEAMSNLNDELKELEYIKIRFYNWKKMFQNISKTELSEEEEQGVYGELYFLYKYMIPKYGIDRAILSWTGPNRYNKDFSIENTWYETKTSSVNAPTIEISSLNQLDSDVDGFLSVIKVEKMSSEYQGSLSSIYELVQVILEKINAIEIQNAFLNKLLLSGIGPENGFGSRHYDVKKTIIYNVSKEFPKLTKENIGFVEIEEATYTINLALIYKFIVEEL